MKKTKSSPPLTHAEIEASLIKSGGTWMTKAEVEEALAENGGALLADMMIDTEHPLLRTETP